MSPVTRRLATGAAAAAAGVAALASFAGEGDWRLSLAATGMREYYCGATLRLENRGAEAMEEIAGHLILTRDGASVGRSRGASFRDVAAGGAAEALFETPNAPCAQADLTLVIGACRIGGAFVPAADCAARIAPSAPVARALAR